MKFSRYTSGFTLIELLVVIAILGVLAAGILVAINPLEQLSRGRDATKKSTISQLGNAVQAYYTSQGGVYPTTGNTWITTVQTSGEIKSVPSAATPGCSNGGLVQNGYCYNSTAADAVVYTLGESASERTRAGCTSGQVVWIVWSSAEGKTGALCTANSTTYPPVGATGLR
jgi:prepilin-type N-terminal cleavage/methylation domain-containing protein